MRPQHLPKIAPCLAVCTAVMGTLAACGSAPPPPSSEPAAQLAIAGEPSAEPLIEAKCGVCHSVDKVRGTTASREEWTAIVGKMQELGAALSDEETKAVIQHLATAQGR